MGIFHKISSWWNKDRTELSDEEASMTQAERDVAEEDYESRKDDVRVKDQWASGRRGQAAWTSSATPKVRRSTEC